MDPVTVPDYQLISKCGRGSFGDVYVAKSLSGSLVALKVIEKNNYSKKEFKGLKYFCSRCANSPFLIKIFHTGETETFFYYTMELADNFGDDENYVPETLANRLVNAKQLTPHAVRKLALNLLSGLETLHRAGLVHRDIKPENIIFVNNVPKLSDIGLVSAVSATFSVGGTLGFIPPEKLKSSSGSKTETDDLYALGKLIYCTFSGNSPERFPSLPEDIVFDEEARKLNEVVLVACNPESPLRFHSIDKFRRALLTSVSRKKRVFNSIWGHRYYWITGILLTLTIILLLNPYVIIPYLTKKYVDIAACSVKNQTQPAMSGNIVIPAEFSASDFKELMNMQLDNNNLDKYKFKVNNYLRELGRKRFTKLKKEYSAYLASLNAIEKLLFKYRPNMVAEIKMLVNRHISRPEMIPEALVSWLSPEIWRDPKMYDLYCNCAIQSENMNTIFLEIRNMLPEALEWDQFFLASRIRNYERKQRFLYKNPIDGRWAGFENVLAAYCKILRNIHQEKKDYYSQRAKRFLKTLYSYVSNPTIVATEYKLPPIKLKLAYAKEISAFAKKNIDAYVITKYDIPDSFYRNGYDRQRYSKLKISTKNKINSLLSFQQQREWCKEQSKIINIMREKELKNSSNPHAAAYQKAKKVLAPFL